MQSAGEGVGLAAGIDKPVCCLVVKRMQVLICIPLRLVVDVGQFGLSRVLNDGWPEDQCLCFLNNLSKRRADVRVYSQSRRLAANSEGWHLVSALRVCG